MALALFAINMLAGMFVASMEISEYSKVMTTMLEHERKVDEGVLPLDVDYVDRRTQEINLWKSAESSRHAIQQ